MGKWKYFKDEEVVGLKDDLVFKLDRAREFFGYPLVITSGYRDPVHNSDIGGAKTSEHTFGNAADIRAPQDTIMREKLCWAFGLAGFKRVESAPRHYHVDISTIKTSPCFWEGDDK